MRLIWLLILSSLPVLAAAQKPSIWLHDMTRSEVITSSDSNVPRSIASITKLMTAMVALDHDRNLDREIKVSGTSKLPGGLHSRRAVMAAMLIRSDNQAAEALASDYPGGRKQFIRAMNIKAKKLNMSFTQFTDPSGLSAGNIATAGEIGILLRESARYPIIVETSVQKQVLIDHKVKQKVRTIELHNTNRPLLFEFDEIIISKTGFTSAAGWCVALMVEKEGRTFTVVILGARTKQERIDIARKVIYNQLVNIEVDYYIEHLPWYQRLIGY